MTQPLLKYDPETGWFTNLVSRGPVAAGTRAGSPTGHGYRRITFNYQKYYEHHLAWFYIHGEWPNEIDHINGNGEDNRISNLRLCSRTQNNFNACRPVGASGLKGAYLDKRNLQWYSKIQIGSRIKFLGNFPSAKEAHKAYMAAVELHHGKFAYHLNSSLTDLERIGYG